MLLALAPLSFHQPKCQVNANIENRDDYEATQKTSQHHCRRVSKEVPCLHFILPNIDDVMHTFAPTV
jgi:hypothetical protein